MTLSHVAWLASAAIVLAAPAATASAQTPSLATCVHRWNAAALGEGHRQIKGVAANGPHALVFAFRDGACGIAFPSPQARDGGVGVFVTALGGAYQLAMAPFSGGTANAAERVPALERAAQHRSNVVVSVRTGHLRALKHARIARSNFRAVDTSESCPMVATSGGNFFDVTRHGIGCAETEVVMEAWVDGDGQTDANGVRRILSWGCERDDPSTVVTCADPSRSFEAQPRPPKIIGSRPSP